MDGDTPRTSSKAGQRGSWNEKQTKAAGSIPAKSLFFSLLLLASSSSANEHYTLAPHPITFSVDGRPTLKEIVVDGKIYIVSWDGKSLGLKVSGNVPRKNFKPPRNIDIGKWGCILPGSFFLWFWLVVAANFLDQTTFFRAFWIGTVFFFISSLTIYVQFFLPGKKK